MSHNEEQGFLFNKFDDWSGEPIPNGWNEIEKKLGRNRKRRPFFWWIFPALLILGGLTFYAVKKVNVQLDQEMIVANNRKENIQDLRPGSQIKPGQNQNGVSAESASEKLIRKQVSKSGGTSGSDEDNLETSGSTTKNQSGSNVERDQSAAEEEVASSIPGQPTHSSVTRKKRLPAVPLLGNTETNLTVAHSSELKTNTSHSSNPANAARSKRDNGFSDAVDNGSLGQDVKLDEPATGAIINRDRKEDDNVEKNSSISDDKLKNVHPELVGIQENSISPEFGYAIQFLEIKFPAMVQETYQMGVPTERQLELLPLADLKPDHNRRTSFYIGIATGIGLNQIGINQSESINKVNITNTNSIQSSFYLVSAEGNFNLTPRLSVFSGLQFGFYRQELMLKNTQKEPVGFGMAMKDSLNYNLNPIWNTNSEKYVQNLIFANVELGIRPLISVRHNSGPFASVQIWTRLATMHSSSLENKTPFVNPTESIALAYKLGYQHRISKFLRAEVFYSSFPSALLGSTKGITIVPRLFGFGLSRVLK